MSVSAALITKNEQSDLPRCLDSLRGVVDEVVVVDTGSTDATVGIAERAGARVFPFPWCDDFSAARNEALSKCTGDWILILDADEELDRESTGALATATQAPEVDGYRLVVRNLQPPADLARWQDVPIVRLFRRHEAHRYEGRIHEQITPSILRRGGTVGSCDVVLIHHGYARTVAQGASRAERNLRLLETMAADEPTDAYLAHQLGTTLVAAGQGERAERELQRALTLGTTLTADVRGRTLTSLAQLALGRGDDRIALDRAQQALALLPDQIAALYVSGVAALAVGDLPTAVASMERATRRPELSPRHRSDVERLLAWCRAQVPSP